MGGAWESLIKSVKRSLKAITLDRIFTEEALYTFLCEVESLLNNRPVTPSSDDINDYEALALNHLKYLVVPRQITHHANAKMMKFTTGKNGVQCKQQLICFGIDGVRNTFQHLFNNGKGTETQKIYNSET